MLGWMYANGHGVAKNGVEALAWMYLGKSNGLPEGSEKSADNFIPALENELGPAMTRAAQSRARDIDASIEKKSSMSPAADAARSPF
ncbi:MAG: hypothetical protein LBU39_10425 [Desulfobulbaceae bacterium]|nr:hypothetical protein [Desulfobulbaceae bacterium]